jgi:putative ABC transport system permease protein
MPSIMPRLALGEILRFAYDTFCTNRIRFLLTALGMAIGTGSLILVVTIGLTGKQYALNQIESIGTNMIEAEYVGGGAENLPNTTVDPLTLDDLVAVRNRVTEVVAASPVLPLSESIPVANGKELAIEVLGVYPEYCLVRNLAVISGRFFDNEDEQAHNKVGLVTQKLALDLYGSPENAVGKVVKLNGLPFTVIGTFRERVDTFGQSEITDNAVVVPFSVARYFTSDPALKQIYFSATDRTTVESATAEIQQIIQSRHRSGSVYKVQNLTQLVAVAQKIANGLTAVLFAVATVVLIVSGIGIMNIMLATVTSRIREIGIRKALGATNREIRLQFLAEAILISLIGGIVGIVSGLALPYSVRFLTDYRIPISGLSAIIAIVVASVVGILFGTVPAARAAQLDPVESLRYE